MSPWARVRPSSACLLASPPGVQFKASHARASAWNGEELIRSAWRKRVEEVKAVESEAQRLYMVH